MKSEADEELKVEDPQHSPESSSWKNMYPFKSFRNYYTRQESFSFSRIGSGRLLSHGCIIHPENWWYVAWTHFILIWAVYSSFFTPMEFAFFRGLPEKFFLLDIAGQFAFLIDIVLRFFVGYRDPHSYCLVHNPNLIAIRYLKSRFLVDLLGCLPWDAIYKASGRKELVRYMLWIRLSRALRVTEFFEKLEKDIRINYLFTRIVKLFVVELYCTHTAACIFYYLATTLPPSEEGYTWIGSLRMGDYSYANFREIDLWTRYITALYFAVVTMATVGYGEIHAVNTREMIFVMMYVSLDMILGAYLLGNMTALIVKGSRTERFRDKMAELIKYMNKNKLGKNISKEISNKLYEPYVREIPLFRGCSNAFLKKVDEVTSPEDSRSKESLPSIQTYSSIGEISVICNIPEPRTVHATELSKLLRIDKQALVEVIEIYLSDGRTIINNLLEGRESDVRNKILESAIALQIEKHESELAMRLNCAANDGDLNRLQHLVEAGADPNKMDYNGQSALHRAASKGYEDIIQFLIQKHVEISPRDHFGRTPLFEAIKNGHDRAASLLVRAGASLSIDDAGNCLCKAVARKDLDFLKRLLANGINPNSKNYDLRAPLHLAASEGLYSESILLLEAGASVFATDRWGRTPIDEARLGGNRDLLKLLEDAKVTQMSKFSCCYERSQDQLTRRKCTVFPGFPWDHRDGRTVGVVLWVPETIEQLIKTAKEQLGFHGGSCLLSENGGKILDVIIILDDQKLFLASDEMHMST
ncbi:UNVERIFIED_CONTAM: Potassium channel SKOR [Sesamum radiatum]|uniref:Potassium channel SKOR n=1 Tax=Sesamum radiatum TaxID=300843 RepID=A0AAW2VIS6_SESRA